jgi:dTMP kinase
VAAQRLAGARVPDKFEAQPQEFFARVAAGYAARAAADPARFLRLEAGQAREAVWRELEAGLKQRGLLA